MLQTGVYCSSGSRGVRLSFHSSGNNRSHRGLSLSHVVVVRRVQPYLSSDSFIIVLRHSGRYSLSWKSDAGAGAFAMWNTQRSESFAGSS